MKISDPIYFILVLLMAILPSCQTTQRENNEETPDLLKKIRGEPVIPRNANTIFIAPISVSAQKKEVADQLKELLIRKLTGKGRLAVRNSPENSDLQVVIKLYTYQVQVLSFDSIGNPEKKRLLIKVYCTMIASKDNRPVFISVPIQAFSEYSSITAPITTDAEAENMVLQDLTLRLVSQIHQGWYTDRMTNIEKGKK